MRITEIITETAAWQKSSGKNKNGGLNKKGVASYRREHPGSKLQTAVTTKPSKLKKDSKASKRRKSFCARMKGMKKHRTGAETKRDPNSRINKSLRKWHCESIEEMRELIILGEQYIANLKEAGSPAQQAAIAIAMKKAGKKPKSKGVAEAQGRDEIGGAGVAYQAGYQDGKRAKSTGVNPQVNTASWGEHIADYRRGMHDAFNLPAKGMEEGITPDVIHKLADRKGVKWDDEPSFLRLTKRLTGKEHLDDLNQDELVKVRDHLKNLDENFADGKNPGRKGLAKRSGVNTKASVSSLRNTAKHSTGEKARMAHWLANMKAGKAKQK